MGLQNLREIIEGRAELGIDGTNKERQLGI
jgi:hypothetical protein